MSQRPWHSTLERELRRRRLPAAYRQRLLEELSDHLSDMETHAMSMDALSPGLIDARLGDPKQIARQAARACRRNFVQRRPVICFVLGPLVGFPLATAALFFLGLTLLDFVAGALEGGPLLSSPAAANAAIHTLAWFARIVPFAAAAAFFVVLARRGKQDWRWSIVAVMLVAILAAAFNAQVVEKLGDQQGQFSMGFSFPMSSPLAYLQVAAPLAIALFAYMRRDRTADPKLAA